MLLPSFASYLSLKVPQCVALHYMQQALVQSSTFAGDNAAHSHAAAQPHLSLEAPLRVTLHQLIV
jgi:hypothetical protein